MDSRFRGNDEILIFDDKFIDSNNETTQTPRR